jgi:NTP pyrophosphatase (non-canonical NTP hydrolase)
MMNYIGKRQVFTMNEHPGKLEVQAKEIDALQRRFELWQLENFPSCTEWELALGVTEEVGEIADCVLKSHRGIRSNEYPEDRLRDAIGDTVIYLFGLCSLRGWKLSDVLFETADLVLRRSWRSPGGHSEESAPRS